MQQHAHGGMGGILSGMAGAPGTTSSDQQTLYDFDDQLAMLQDTSWNQLLPQHHQTHQTNPLAPHHRSHSMALNSRSQSGQYDTPRSMNRMGTNCLAATDMITNMSSGAHPLDVRAELGCLPQHGMDCDVDNQVVFSVMDRYSGQGIGL